MDSKEDEEITIDFSKIKNFFKGKKEEKKAEAAIKDIKEPANEEKDEDISLSFDFSKIKRIFKPGEQERKEEDVSVNWSKVFDFLKTYGVVFIALIPIILSIYVRMQAGYLPFADDWARNSVTNNIRSQITSAIDQQYPNLPDANKNALIDGEIQKVMSQNKKQIDDQVKATSDYVKSFFQDESGKNYMPDIDPYYWFRYAKNIVEHGHPGDVLKDGKPFDNHQLAPIGRFVQPDLFHVYFLVYFYKFLHFFAPGLTLMRSMFYYPVFVSALAVLIVFFIGKKVAGNAGGFFAGLMMAVNMAFLGRTLFGHADSDAWVVFFPLLITWLFVTAIDVKSTLKIVIITLLAGFFTGLYTFAWTGWWYVFDFLLATIALEFLYLFYISFRQKGGNLRLTLSDTAIKNIVILGLVYFVSTAVFVTLFSSWSMFLGSFLGPLSFPSIKAPVSASLWPNVLTTVAELNEGSVNGIINSIGGPFLFFISLLGLVLAISRIGGIKRFDFIYIIGSALFYGAYFLSKRAGYEVPLAGLLVWIVLPVLARIGISLYKKDLSYDFRLSILLSLWIVSTIFASIKGIRFTILLAPAFSVAFGVALGKIYIYLSKLMSKEFKIHKAIGSSVLILLLLWVFYLSPVRGAISTSGSDMPLVNDAWYNALTAIKQGSGENAIITSWWDFGHHFKAIANRPVTFDGTTQTQPAAHWVGRLLMTDNEKEAVGILRMLDCGSNSAFGALYEANNDTHLSLKILHEIVLLDKKDAEKRLKELKFGETQIEKILSYSHCNPPEAYFIASEDMIGKSGVWAHFGSWNFERADLWQNARKMPQEKAVEYMMKKFNYTKEKAENIYFEMQAITSDSEVNSWVAPWPGYGGTTSCSRKDDGIYACDNGFQINMSSYDTFAIGQQGIARPKAAAFTTKDGLLKKEFEGSTLDFGATVIPKSENDLAVVLSSTELTGSMFTRMFYMQGHGLSYFKLFDHQRGLTGTEIYTYKVDWEGKNATIVNEYIDYLEPAKEENASGSENPIQPENDSTATA